MIMHSIMDLGTLGGSASWAQGINNLGQVVGQLSLPNGTLHAFRTAPNSPINRATDDLGTLGGVNSFAAAINNLGEVVGSAGSNAFLCRNGIVFNLNGLIPYNSDWVLSEARSINDNGQIVGFGKFNGETRVFS